MSYLTQIGDGYAWDAGVERLDLPVDCLGEGMEETEAASAVVTTSGDGRAIRWERFKAVRTPPPRLF